MRTTIEPKILRANALRIRQDNSMFVTAENLDLAASTIDRLERRLVLSLQRATDFQNALYELTNTAAR